MRRNDGVRVPHKKKGWRESSPWEKERWGEKSPSERAMG